jgi:hypothetical protein
VLRNSKRADETVSLSRMDSGSDATPICEPSKCDSSWPVSGDNDLWDDGIHIRCIAGLFYEEPHDMWTKSDSFRICFPQKHRHTKTESDIQATRLHCLDR